jgi:hypothetical protein
MTTTPDEFEFEIERSRAAVTIACLEWLRCTGPATSPRTPSARVTSPDAVEIHHESPTNLHLIQNLDHPHPLWDRWIDR